jgi:hypothetical protein
VLRNGTPFKGLILPAGIERVRRTLAGAVDGDRQRARRTAEALICAGIEGGSPA